jgi:hypothetical protein
MCYPGHQWPPATFKPVLEKYHLIWIGVIVATDSRPVEQHAGLLLDAACNVRKIWPTDSNRIYLASVNCQGPINGMAFYYSDIFPGTIIAPGLDWFYKLKDPRPNVGMWDTDKMARPQAADWDRAKSRSRFFLALRDAENPNNKLYDDEILHQGYQAAGFRHVKAQRVPYADQERYIDWKSGWFEQGVQFLDESQEKGAAASQPAIAGQVPANVPVVGAANTGDSAAKADGALEMAKNYITLGKYDRARDRLNQIVSTYPDTAAAAQAKKLLKDINGK